MAGVTSQATNSQDNPLAGFGPNEWIVEDMYQRYLADPASVDPAWHDFFADYRPAGGDRAAPSAPQPPTPASRDRGRRGDRRPDGDRDPGRRHGGRRRAAAPRRRRGARPGTDADPGEGRAEASAAPAAQAAPAARDGADPRASPPGSCRTWTRRCRCPPRPACGPCRRSCSPTTAS